MAQSKYTKFDIPFTPYHKYLLRQLIKALNEVDIDVSLYYSILGWHNPNYRYSIESKSDRIA